MAAVNFQKNIYEAPAPVYCKVIAHINFVIGTNFVSDKHVFYGLHKGIIVFKTKEQRTAPVCYEILEFGRDQRRDNKSSLPTQLSHTPSFSPFSTPTAAQGEEISC